MISLIAVLLILAVANGHVIERGLMDAFMPVCFLSGAGAEALVLFIK